MADLPETDFDDQDVAEVFDEDNTNLETRGHGETEDAEQFEDLPDVYDATSAVGDQDDDDSTIGEDLDDEDVIAAAWDDDDDDDDLEDDDLAGRDGEAFNEEDDVDDDDLDDDDPDEVDAIDRLEPDEVELTYAGDLTDVEGAEGSAADMESEGELSDEDLRELDYKEANRG